MRTPCDIADRLDAFADEVRSLPPRWSLVVAVRSGCVLTSDQAGFIAATSGETVRRRCEQTAASDRPLGVKVAGSWLVDRETLLDMIEDERGHHDRLAAETRAQKIAALWASPQAVAKIA
jgi:hypothetical protein